MYHSVSGTGQRDDLTVDAGQLEAQFRYLRTHGYTTISFSDLIAATEGEGTLPEKAVLITFDDGFRNNYEIAYPLACQYRIRINLFVVPDFIHKGEYHGIPCLTAEEINKMDPDLVEIGLHSFDHRNYAGLGSFRLASDMELSMVALKAMEIAYQPCFAYPYANYNKNDLAKQQAMFSILNKHDVRYAFKVGDRLNKMPFKGNMFLLKRLTVNGNYSMMQFKLMLLGFIRITQRLERILK